GRVDEGSEESSVGGSGDPGIRNAGSADTTHGSRREPYSSEAESEEQTSIWRMRAKAEPQLAAEVLKSVTQPHAYAVFLLINRRIRHTYFEWREGVSRYVSR